MPRGQVFDISAVELLGDRCAPQTALRRNVERARAPLLDQTVDDLAGDFAGGLRIAADVLQQGRGEFVLQSRRGRAARVQNRLSHALGVRVLRWPR